MKTKTFYGNSMQYGPEQPKWCEYCGYDLEDEETCPKCGHNENGEYFCEKCNYCFDESEIWLNDAMLCPKCETQIKE